MYYPSKLYSRESATDKTKYIYVSNTLVATVRTKDSIVSPYYIHTDHLGSTNAVSSNTGTSEILDYYSYGSERISTGSCDLKRKYIGQYCDNDTALAYLNARYYNSYSGRFISIDPMFWSPERFLLDPQSLNAYSYARNNPITFSDSSGKSPEEWGTWQYWEDSGAQLIKGNYTENVTLFGTAGQVLTGIFGVDLPGDIRDVFYDLSNWEWSWDHAGKTGLDVISFVPVIGVLKYSDEDKVVLKSGEVKNVFRGGSSLEISKNQLNIDKNSGKILPGKGASVNINPKDPNILKYGGPYRVDSLSEGLKIEQRGKSLDHYEIMPKSAMTFEKYQELLNKIKLTPINK